MDFIPKADWKWVYDHSKGTLSVVDRDRTFSLAYQKNMLLLKESQILDFSVADVTRYIELFDSPSLIHFEEPIRARIILHLLAFDIFHKPIMPKSWLFKTVEHIEDNYEYGEQVILTSLDAEETAQFMILEQDSDFCLCMLLDKFHFITSTKKLKQFQLMKVTVDKLTRVTQA